MCSRADDTHGTLPHPQPWLLGSCPRMWRRLYRSLSSWPCRQLATSSDGSSSLSTPGEAFHAPGIVLSLIPRPSTAPQPNKQQGEAKAHQKRNRSAHHSEPPQALPEYGTYGGPFRAYNVRSPANPFLRERRPSRDIASERPRWPGRTVMFTEGHAARTTSQSHYTAHTGLGLSVPSPHTLSIHSNRNS